jgi:hypothetical protein
VARFASRDRRGVELGEIGAPKVLGVGPAVRLRRIVDGLDLVVGRLIAVLEEGERRGRDKIRNRGGIDIELLGRVRPEVIFSKFGHR